MANTENKDTVIPSLLLKSNKTSTKYFIKKSEEDNTVGYDLTVSSHNSPSTSKLRTLYMSEMEVEYNIKKQDLTSITFKDTSVNKEIKLFKDGSGVITVVDGMYTLGENSQKRKVNREQIVHLSINQGPEYQSPFDIDSIYKDVTGDTLPTATNLIVEEPQEYWWSGYSIEEVSKSLGLNMNLETFKKVMMKMHDLFEREESIEDTVDTPTLVVKALDAELMETIEIVYIPDVKDLHGEWMSKEEIVKGEANFSDNLKSGVVKGNLFHAVDTDKFTIEDSWVTKMDGTYGKDSTFIAEGTWLAKCKFHDTALWEMKKSNELGGLSFGGRAFVDESTGEITGLSFDPTTHTNSVAAIFDTHEE